MAIISNFWPAAAARRAQVAPVTHTPPKPTAPARRVVKGERGSVHVYQPKWTEPDPDHPGQRRLRTADTYNYRFWWRNKPYRGGDNYRTKAEAREAGEKRKAEVRRGLEQDPQKTTFALLERILTAESMIQKPTTSVSTLGVLARLRDFFKDDRLGEIRRARIIEYVAHQRANGYQDSTISLDLRRLRHAMVLAHDDGAMLAVPQFPKIEVRPRQQTIQPHELESILAQLPEHWVRYYLIADEIGWRARSEIRSRKWTDVDWGPDAWACACSIAARSDDECRSCQRSRPGWIHLDAEHNKTGKARSFPLTARLRRYLQDQRAWIDALQEQTGRVIPTVFAKGDGTAIGDPRAAWATATARAGFGRLEGRTGPWSSSKVPHDIRRTVLRRWSTLGEGIDVRMAAAGHSSERTHMGYLSDVPDLDSLQAFADRLNAAAAASVAPVRASTAGAPPPPEEIRDADLEGWYRVHGGDGGNSEGPSASAEIQARDRLICRLIDEVRRLRGRAD